MLTPVKYIYIFFFSCSVPKGNFHEQIDGLCLEEKETVLGGSVRSSVYRVSVYTYVCIYA